MDKGKLGGQCEAMEGNERQEHVHSYDGIFMRHKCMREGSD